MTNACGVGVDDNEAIGEQANIVLRMRDNSSKQRENFVKFQRSRNVIVQTFVTMLEEFGHTRVVCGWDLICTLL